jgi:two-component sensor histidine kinase
MWFSSSIGVIRFDPDKVEDNSKIPPIYLTSITQGGEKIEVGMAPEKVRKIELDWQNNFFEFEYVALNYTRPEKNQYAYMLEGLDKDWFQAGTRRFGRYTGIPPGQYILKIKGSNNDGVWNEEGVSIKVTVETPVWQTWWYRALIVVLVLGSVIGVVIWRFRQVKSQRQNLEIQVDERTKELSTILKEKELLYVELKHQLSEKEIILKEVHHRIKNNFATIGSLLSLQAQSTGPPEAISALQDAIGRVKSLEVLYEKLLLTDDYGVTSVREYLSNLTDDIISIFSKDIDITLEKQIDDFQLDPKQLVPIGIIVNELLTNAMKYAFSRRASNSIEIIVQENQGNVSLIIQDNGKGLPEGFDISESKGFGLRLVKILSEQLEGSFTIENNNGTRSTLEFNI